MRRIAKLLVLVAVLLMPFGMAAAAAAAPAEHHAMAGIGHCSDDQGEADAAPGIAACTMVCAGALPAFDHVQPERVATMPLRPPVRLAMDLTGLHPEAATPPPRTA